MTNPCYEALRFPVRVPVPGSRLLYPVLNKTAKINLHFWPHQFWNRTPQYPCPNPNPKFHMSKSLSMTGSSSITASGFAILPSSCSEPDPCTFISDSGPEPKFWDWYRISYWMIINNAPHPVYEPGSGTIYSQLPRLVPNYQFLTAVPVPEPDIRLRTQSGTSLPSNLIILPNQSMKKLS